MIPGFLENDMSIRYYQISVEDKTICLASSSVLRPSSIEVTNEVKSIALSIYNHFNLTQKEAFGAMPILADALEEIGCVDEEILLHCRIPQEHQCDCWVLGLILGHNKPEITSETLRSCGFFLGAGNHEDGQRYSVEIFKYGEDYYEILCQEDRNEALEMNVGLNEFFEIQREKRQSVSPLKVMEIL